MNSRIIPEKVFRDPVHDYIHIQDRLILDLINTREFQRLRRIKQLGASSFTFHGAEHSRFGHSLGVYEITRQIVNKFEQLYPSQEANDGLWDTSERLVALSAALLHDIGHGPFSHAFEGIFQTDHEQLTQRIILSESTEINQVLRTIHPDFPQRVASVINKTYPNQQVVQLISSQLDADRMDYLLRDAYYAGVSYGTFDLTRILRVMRPYKRQIIFDFSGMHAIEHYIISRYQMYMQIYFHAVSRGMESILKSLFSRAKYCYTTKPEAMKTQVPLLTPFLDGSWQLADYLRLDDHVMSAYFNQWIDDNDAILADLAQRFLGRKPFKSLLIQNEEGKQLHIALQQELVKHGFDPQYYLFENTSSDLPYDYYRANKPSKRTQIELLTKMEQKVELSQVSPLIEALTGIIRGDKRLYFPKEILTFAEQTPEDQRNPDQEMIILAYKNERSDVTQNIQQRLF